MRFPQGYRRWRGSSEVASSVEDLPLCAPSSYKQQRSKLAVYKPRTITAPTNALSATMATTATKDTGQCIHHECPHCTASDNGRITASFTVVNAPENTNRSLHHRSTTIDKHRRERKHVKQWGETTTLLDQCPLPNHLCNRNVNCGGGFASALLHRLWGAISTSTDDWRSRI
jgi:hypothetical protein